MPIPERNAVKNLKTEETALDEISLLQMMHELTNVLDGTRRYAKLLTNEISESDPLRIYAESVRANLDRMSDMHETMLNIIKGEFRLLPKT